MTIARLAPGSDLAPLGAIHAACFADAWDARALSDLLAMPGAFAFADRNGFILVRAAAGEAEILTLAVVPAARRKGLARALVIAAASHAQTLGAHVIFLEVAVTNMAAKELYRSLGFAEIGKRKNYYASAGARAEDALVLRSNLPLSPLGKSAGAG